MTKFNPEGKEVLTYGECLTPAMGITQQEDADQYKRDYIAYTQRQLDKEPRKDDKTAEDIVNTNIGYFAGYYDLKTYKRVHKLFKCNHPVFGTEYPTAEKAFSAGKQISENKKAGK